MIQNNDSIDNDVNSSRSSNRELLELSIEMSRRTKINKHIGQQK